jgi:hypothetical protein
MLLILRAPPAPKKLAFRSYGGARLKWIQSGNNEKSFPRGTLLAQQHISQRGLLSRLERRMLAIDSRASPSKKDMHTLVASTGLHVKGGRRFLLLRKRWKIKDVAECCVQKAQVFDVLETVSLYKAWTMDIMMRREQIVGCISLIRGHHAGPEPVSSWYSQTSIHALNWSKMVVLIAKST